MTESMDLCCNFCWLHSYYYVFPLCGCPLCILTAEIIRLTVVQFLCQRLPVSKLHGATILPCSFVTLTHHLIPLRSSLQYGHNQSVADLSNDKQKMCCALWISHHLPSAVFYSWYKFTRWLFRRQLPLGEPVLCSSSQSLLRFPLHEAHYF